MIDMSKTYANAIKDLYIKGVWLASYAILKASEWADKGKINAKDFEELIEFLVAEQEKEMKEEVTEKLIEETAEEPAEETEVE